MENLDRYCDDSTCDISGPQDADNISYCPLIPSSVAEGDELDILHQEWVYGLPRGGLPYYLGSRANCVVLRQDICSMFTHGEFILAPTYKTYLDTMRFVEHAGVKNRKERDHSLRRPLTALPSHNGLYRYVFIACTDAARALQKEFNLQPQTTEDLNGGLNPISNKPFLEGSDQFPVLECRAHPFSVAYCADKVLRKRSTRLTGQWHSIVHRMMSTWTYRDIKPPQWFVEAPKLKVDDVALTPSVASGYELQSLSREPKANPFAVLGNPELLETDYRRVVADWTCNKVVYKHPPPEEKPIRTEYKLRRSARLHKCPYDRDGPPPSPTRNGRRALLTCRRNYELVPPSWAARNGGYPTRTFSSNDWAYFQYGVHLPGSWRT
ncbi:hypothetical protein K525DRAFT_212498 [Schizophyllum commune Loenen D]|nr:hypothetical protein K525DRAFT_212498 [Schizophyllum commune Loenen D]